MRKILCKLGYHNWESSYEDFRVNFVLPKGFSHLQSSFPSKLLSYKEVVIKNKEETFQSGQIVI